MTTILNNVDFHLNLKKSQFKTPIEVIKKNFKNLQKLIDKQEILINKNLKLLKSGSLNKSEKLELIKKTISLQETYLKKLKVRVKSHNDFISRLQYRISKLEELKKLNESLKNDENGGGGEGDNDNLNQFYKGEVELLIVDYLLKSSIYNTNTSIDDELTGIQLAKSLKIDKLIDYDVILQGLKIYNEIKEKKNLKILIDWCFENKKNLKLIKEKYNLNLNIEFETYFQKFIELIKIGDVFNALNIANNYLIGYLNEDEHDDDNIGENFEKIVQGAALLCWNLAENTDKAIADTKSQVSRKALSYYDSNIQTDYNISENFKNYKSLLSDDKWTKLADFFLFNFNSLYGIDQDLQICLLLSIGSSSLKTRSCKHRKKDAESSNDNENDVNFDDYLNLTSDSNKDGILKNDCPICSIDLNELTSSLPFSHQIKTNIFENPVMLPNGNIYQFEKLVQFNKSQPKDIFSTKNTGGLTVEYDNEEEEESNKEITMENLELLKIKDPLNGELFDKSDIVKVFPT
ncbi:hypothetical protein CANARDRAFT_10452 [[Candida] arabinofermentans NRRL YB-2248]|uniref:RING-Gid-type domain-containing protein n=1 Tax=[Candida] arabinofermentans NRRL YB-2248 TaxID=983967 RepID=A0A1E4SSQ4_9ASCO|nr:hypothetical protein CANARDRAFT_10452 [[Candida] arabinofermentans NRRL YB-2248]